MKLYKASLTIIGAMMLALGLGGTAMAFHDGGVAYCDGCHTMHNSSKGVKMTVNSPGANVANAYLLQGSDQSSTCLKCHNTSGATPSSYHINTYPAPGAGSAPTQLTPGGDFAWLQKSYSWTTPRAGSSAGERHGHNIIAADYNYVADATLTVAPGGSYPNTSLGCNSCHDPHSSARIVDAAGTIGHRTPGSAVLPISGSGSYGAMPTATEAVGVYRLLGGIGYQPDSVVGSFAFTADSPIAVAPATYNRSESATDTRVAYGSGMSEWCSNCHTNMHNDSVDTNLRHPASNAAKLPVDILTNYNTYVKSGDLSGSNATAYTSMVPYEEGTADRAALTAHAVIDGSVKIGPDANSNVMCLSCHRAHASAWDSMSRWNNSSEFLTVAGNWPGTDAPTTEGQNGTYSSGKTMAEYQQAMYGRPATLYATFQRSLCNKCHAKD